MTKGFTTETRRHRGNITHAAFLRVLCASVFFIIFIFSSPKTVLGVKKCRTDVPYYFNEFNSALWKVEDELNYEEVYKNFEYFEVIFNKGCDEITVKKYRMGAVETLKKYRLAVDGTLQELPN